MDSISFLRNSYINEIASYQNKTNNKPVQWFLHNPPSNLINPSPNRRAASETMKGAGGSEYKYALDHSFEN